MIDLVNGNWFFLISILAFMQSYGYMANLENHYQKLPTFK